MRDEDICLGRVQERTRSLKEVLPKYRAVRINMRAHANAAIEKMDGPGGERVSKILAELNALTPDRDETIKAA